MLSLLGPTTGSALFVIAGVISIVVLIIVISIAMMLLVVIKKAAKKRNVDFSSGNDIMTIYRLYHVMLYL